MVINWGKCDIYYKKLTSSDSYATVKASAVGTWTKFPTPKEGSTNLNTSAGTKVNATVEGGAIIDSRTPKSTFELVWEDYVRKGETIAAEIKDLDGLIVGEFAIRLVPAEDNACPGFAMYKTNLTVVQKYTAADGQTREYHAAAELFDDAEDTRQLDTYTYSAS